MSNPLRAVPDTNVLVAAAIKPTGLCRELLDAAITREWQPVVSPLLLSELVGLLEMFHRKPSPEAQAFRALSALFSVQGFEKAH